MEKQQTLQIICLQTRLTHYHYQTYSIFKGHLVERIHLARTSSLAQHPALVILPECTGAWLYFMCVPMPQFLRDYFFNSPPTKTNRHLLFIGYTLLTHIRRFSKHIYRNYHSKCTWLGLIKHSWFTLFATETSSIYKQLFGEIARETNSTIVAGSIFMPADPGNTKLYNISCVFEPNHGSVCLQVGKQYPVSDELSFIQPYEPPSLPSIYSIPDTNVDIGVLICADSWMPQVYDQYRQIVFEADRRFLFLIIALNTDEWNIPWPGYDPLHHVNEEHISTYSLPEAWFHYAIHRGFTVLSERTDLVGYGVVCCHGILNLMNDILAQGESSILIKRSNVDTSSSSEVECAGDSYLKQNSPQMNKEVLIDVGSQLAHLRMYPLFDMCHYLLTALAVRDDIQQYQTGTPNFPRRHPFSCWLSTMLLCFSGSIFSNFLLGRSPIQDFLHYQHLLLATTCWYLIFYSPFDLINRLARFLPIRLLLGLAKEIQRTNKIYKGVHSTVAGYPDAYLIIVLIGAVRGCGGAMMSSLDRFIRGVWLPGQHEFLFPSFVTKACFLSSTVFLLSHLQLLQFDRELIYLCVVSMFVYVRVITLFFKQYDPLMPFENLSSGILFNSWIDTISDAYRRATATSPLETQSHATTSNTTPSLPNTSTTGAMINDNQIKGHDGRK